ncbi:MAG: hypothetical protein E6G00_13435 [Actinobacteria bacterium]|nr:MAG: hypothetical protein E6G00_13435 [Actinomycetota bacterium]
MRPRVLSQHTQTSTDWSRIAVGVAIALALAELIDAFFIEVPAAAVVMAALFVAAVLWTRRGRIGGLVLIAFLLAIEIVFIPTYNRSNVGDWIFQIAIGVVSAVGLVATVAAIREYRTRPEVSNQA